MPERSFGGMVIRYDLEAQRTSRYGDSRYTNPLRACDGGSRASWAASGPTLARGGHPNKIKVNPNAPALSTVIEGEWVLSDFSMTLITGRMHAKQSRYQAAPTSLGAYI